MIYDCFKYSNKDNFQVNATLESDIIFMAYLIAEESDSRVYCDEIFSCIDIWFIYSALGIVS